MLLYFLCILNLEDIVHEPDPQVLAIGTILGE